MPSTNKTDKFKLSQFEPTDKPSFIQDYNADMWTIDTALSVAEWEAVGMDARTYDLCPIDIPDAQLGDVADARPFPVRTLNRPAVTRGRRWVLPQKARQETPICRSIPKQNNFQPKQ